MARGLALLAVAAAGCFFQPRAPGGTADGGDAPGGRDAMAIDSPTAGHNIMFVSSGVFTGLPLTLGADASFCSSAAQTAQLPGNYIGWLSHPTYGNAADRLRAEPAARGWYRPDGMPFADTVDDIITGNILNPPIIDENRHNVLVADPNVSVATGTQANGTIASGYGAECSQGIEIGKPADSPAGAWTDVGHAACSANSLRIYCFSFGFGL